MRRLWSHALPVGIVATGALALLAACTERNSLPTVPSISTSEPSAWTRIYPTGTAASFYAVWGMDADDMWAVGDGGVVVHYDGRQLGIVTTPARLPLIAIDGCTPDDVWAVSEEEILHWDGHDWTLVAPPADLDIRHVACRASGEVYVAGWIDQVIGVYRYEDGGWHDMGFTADPEGWLDLEDLWSAGAGYPLILATNHQTYRLVGDQWIRFDPQLRVMDHDGDLIMGRLGTDADRRLLRMDHDTNLTILCDDFDPGFPDLIAAAQVVVACDFNDVWSSTPCERTEEVPLGQTTLQDLATPQRPFAAARAVFAVGHEGGFFQGAVQPDLTVVWRDLWPGDHRRLMNVLFGDPDHVYTTSSVSGSLGMATGTTVTFDDAVYALWQPRVLPDGSVAALCQRQIRCRHTDGSWHDIGPAFASYVDHIWTDGADHAMLSRGSEVWALVAGSWARLDSPPFFLAALDGFGPGEIYARGGGQLARFDGVTWTTLIDGDEIYVNAMYCGPLSGRVYLRGRRSDFSYLAGHLEDDVFVEDPFSPVLFWSPERTCEVAPGVLYCLAEESGASRQGIYRRASGNWEAVDTSGIVDDFAAFFAAANLGFFAVDRDGNLYHRDFPAGAP